MSAAARLVLISDFNLATLAGILENDDDPPRVRATTAPFGDVVPALVDPHHAAFAEGCDAAIVWTRPEAMVPSFADVVAQRGTDPPQVIAEVDVYAARVAGLAARVPRVLVPTWVVAPSLRGLGPLDLRTGGVGRTLFDMNGRLLHRLDDHASVFTFDTQRWIASAGSGAHDPRAWYMGKIPFGAEVFREAACDFKATLAASAGRARKLIVIDLDDTLWGGVVGEVGWEGLQLGGHDPVGESFVDVQHALRALRARGILLAIASKNDEAAALAALRQHPEMILKPEDFVAWRIDWNDKAANVAALARELNLGLDAVVFIDDSPAERARVREALPEVLVPEWPEQKMQRVAALQRLRCFDAVAISAEDAARTAMYATERERTRAQTTVGSLPEWQRTLELRVEVRPFARADLKRVVQLLNKTNQMNLRTRRTTEADLPVWLQAGRRQLWAFRVRDRFGDAGLTGVVSVEYLGEEARLVDFVLSCRVFGREIERVMMATAVNHARAAGARTLVAEYLESPRNQPTLDFLRRSGLAERDGTFRWPVAEPYPVPDFITVESGG